MKLSSTIPQLALSAVALLLAAQSAKSQLLYSEDFDIDHTANWTVNASSGTHPVNFFFDYSTVGIPTAPHSTGGSTLGLKMQGNTTGNVFGGVSVSPNGQSFSGNYTLKFDMWMNYQASAPAGSGINLGGNGTTQSGGAGIGTAGTTAQWAGGTWDSIGFNMTGDGGSTQDYRVYPAGGLATPASGVYAAGTVTTPTDTRNDTHTYYSGLGTKTAPAAQVTLFPNQTGTTRPGAAGFAWRDIEITKIGNTVTWSIDGLLIATVNASTLTLGGGNILLDYFDTNSSSTTDGALAAALLFGLVDNVSVTQVPEPSTIALAIMGGLGVIYLRRRK